MRHDDPSITPGPSNVPDSSPRARIRVWLWAGFLGVLIGLTSLALALWASSWLVPPYLLLMALILFPPGRGGDTAGLEGPRPRPVPNPEGADDRAKVEGDHQAPAEPVPLAEVSGVPETAPEPGPVAAKARRGRGRGRGKATVAVEPPGANATWVRVGPGKFVRAEIPDPTVEESAPAIEAEPDRPQVPVPSATEGLPEFDAPVADDLGALEPRVKAAPVEPVAEPEFSSCAEVRPPRTPEGVEGAGQSGSDAPTSLPSADDAPVIAEDVTTLEEPGRSDEPSGADPSPSVEEVTPPHSVESDVSDQVAEAVDLESHREESIVEGCGHDGLLILSEDDAVAATPVIAKDVATVEGPGRVDEPVSVEPVEGDPSPTVEEATPPRAAEPDTSDQVVEAEHVVEVAGTESPCGESCGDACGSEGPLPPSEEDAAAVTPVSVEGVATVEEPGRSDEPAEGEPSPSREGVTPPRAEEPDASGQVAEAEEPGSSHVASCGVDCGGDGPLTRAEGDQAFEVEKEAAVAAEEAPAARRADDPEIGPGEASGDHGLAPEVPVAAWFGEIDVVPPGGVGKDRLASAASPGLSPRSTHLALADSLDRACWPRTRAATSDTVVAPSRRRARSGRGARVTPDPRRRSPRGAVRSRRSFRTFPPRPPPRELPTRWKRGRRRAS